MKTFEQHFDYYSENIGRKTTREEHEAAFFAWESALKTKRDPVADVLCNEGLSDAVFHEEHGTITLRTPEGWLLCNLEDKSVKTLGDLVERVVLNLKSHEEDRDR